MCSHYQGVQDPKTLKEVFQVEPPTQLGKVDLWPGYQGLFIRRPREKDSGDEAVPDREALPDLFGLVPHWAIDLKICRSTYNARSETVAEKPSFLDAWRNAQHCIVPVEWIYEPDWRSGTAVPTRIQRRDDKPMGLAGLWTSNRKATGEEVLSFTMLTINADDHDLFRQFHKPQDEKRMVVILREDQYDEWLDAPAARSMAFMRQFPAELLMATAEPNRGKRTA